MIAGRYGRRQVVYEEEVTSISRKGESRTVVVEGVLAMVRRLRRRTVRDCSLASRRPAVATGSFASRQIAALCHLRLAILFGRNKLHCPELEALHIESSRQFLCHNYNYQFFRSPVRSQGSVRNLWWSLNPYHTSVASVPELMSPLSAPNY